MAPPPSHSQSVLPNSNILLLEGIERNENGFTLEVRTCQKPRCPDCGELSAPATAIIGATSRIFPGKVFPFEFASRRAVSGAATLGVSARYSLSGCQTWLFLTLAKRTAWRISFV